jgi:drug/metabolite transporter (DMT)-like permease
MASKGRSKGISAALASALFLGFAPIFGKQSILLGFSPLAVVAIRTGIAALLLLVIMAVFRRQFFYIYSLGLYGCLLAGFINGMGSILYYSALARLHAGIGQLLYSFYPLFVALWLMLDRQPINKLTLVRLGISIPGAFLLLGFAQEQIDPIGAAMMVASAVLYALHLIINQRILYEVPAPTVTFYTLVAMAGTVIAAYLIFNPQLPASETSWLPLIALALITFASRITLFMGVKHLGGLQTALLGLGELIVTIVVATLWLRESLTQIQWVGAFLLALNLFLVNFDRPTPEKRRTSGLLAWLNPPKITPSDYPWQSHP